MIHDLSVEEHRKITVALVTGEDLGPALYEKLFNFYCDSGEMPYGVAKARDGDPMEWIYSRLETLVSRNTQ